MENLKSLQGDLVGKGGPKINDKYRLCFLCPWPSVDLHVILGRLFGGAWPWELPSVSVKTEPI